jgi:quercetin dioxygenase-like cupin family protein
MLEAYLLYTVDDGHSHVTGWRIADGELFATESIRFAESAAHASLDWHTAPTTQYVITLSGTLEFTVHGDETFIVRPGDVIVAVDTTGSGHRWRWLDDQPWRRIYVSFKNDAKTAFVSLN